MKYTKYILLVFLSVFIFDYAIAGAVKRDVSTSRPPTSAIVTVQNQMNEFKKCVDENLAKTIDTISTDQIRPVFELIGNEVQRYMKAWEVLTEPIKPKPTTTKDDIEE